jgi:hypothetical protein
MAIAEHLDMRRPVGWDHRHDIDLGPIEAVERVLRRAAIDRRILFTQPVLRIEAPAGRDIADRDRAVVDPHDVGALPVRIGARRELEEFERMTFGIAELDGRHPARGLGKRYRTPSADRRGACFARTSPCSLRVVRDECEVLENEIAGGRIIRIWVTRMVEPFEVHAASAERHRDARTGAWEAEQLHLRSRNRRGFMDVETDCSIKGGQPRGISGNEPKACYRLESHVRWHGARFGSTWSWTVIRQQGSSPIVPDLWPFLPSVSVQP